MHTDLFVPFISLHSTAPASEMSLQADNGDKNIQHLSPSWAVNTEKGAVWVDEELIRLGFKMHLL